MKLDEKGKSENHDALLGPGKRHISVVIYPVRAETDLGRGLVHAGPEVLLGVGGSRARGTRTRGGVGIVNLMGALAVGEHRVRKYEGAAVYDEADLEPEKAVQPVGEVGERLSSLRVSGTLFTSFRVGTMGAGGGCAAIRVAVAYSIRTGTDMGTCTMDTMRDRIACHAVQVRIGGRCRVPFWFWELGG